MSQLVMRPSRLPSRSNRTAKHGSVRLLQRTWGEVTVVREVEADWGRPSQRL